MDHLDLDRTHRVYSRNALYYRWLHHLTTLGADSRWRRTAARMMPKDSIKILDLCTGTGLTAREILHLIPECTIIGIDITKNMLLKGLKQTKSTQNVFYVAGDVQFMPFPDNSFDAVTCICGLGGVRSPEKALAQVCRVLRPGGIFFNVEMCTPPGLGKTVFHKLVVEPVIQKIWAFRDINIESLVKKTGLQILKCDYRMERGLGSICEILACH